MKILAIEPNKENVELLKRNIMLNKVEKRIYIEESINQINLLNKLFI